MHHERTDNAQRRPIWALIVLLAAFGLSAAQRPLAAFAPAESLVTLSMNAQPQGFGNLGEALAGLEWSRLGSLLERTAATVDDRDLQQMLEMWGDLEHVDQLLGELDAECPGLGGPLSELMEGNPFDEALLTVSLSPFNPVPAVSAFARVHPAFEASAFGLHEALARCFGNATFDQDGVAITLLADGSDLPLLIAVVEDVFMASTNPEVLRAAVRLAGGSSEANLAATALWQAGERLDPGGLGISLDLAAAADALENLAVFMINDPESEYAANRALAALRTTGGFVGRVGLQPEGILFESLLAVNPEGGDEALAELLLCRACTVSRPFLAPADAVGIESQYLALREGVAYLQSWLDDLGPLVGEDLDLRRLLREEFGFDLDSALLDWVGNQLHTVQLEAFSPNLRTLIYSAPVAYLIPVASVEQAQAGLAEIGRVFEPIAAELLSSARGMGALNDFAGMPGLGNGFAVREGAYRGVDVTRIQAGFNVDIGIAFVGNHLAIGTPATAVEPLIDTYLGGETALANPGYRAAVAAAPSSVGALGYSDYTGSLEGAHELLSVLVQPLAGLIDTGLSAMTADRSDSDFGGGFGGGGFADLFGLTARQLTLSTGSTSVGGDLTPEDEDNQGNYADYFELNGLEAGDRVTVVVTSSSFDTYLYLIDADSELVVDSDDDSPDTSRSELRFVVEPGGRYWVEVASFGGTSTGSYRLTLDVAGGQGDPAMRAGPPSFGEILEALEVLPEALEVLAAHVETAESYRHVEGGGVYGRHLTRIRW